MAAKRILIALAHPDDESFGLGGVIVKYTRAGTQVDYICATNGNRGTVAPEFLEKYRSVEEVRYAELDCASAVLGLRQVYKLDYNDSGMMGSPENTLPGALWSADEDEVTGKIVAIMREVQPQVVITFDPFGGYGHPDHIFMHRATTRAFHAAGVPAQFPGTGAPYAPQKLYYSAFPKTLMRLFLLQMRLRGQDPRKMGVNQDLDFLEVYENALDPTTRITVGQFLREYEAASNCHASQLSVRDRTPRLMQWLLFRQQGLVRACPPPQPGEPLERDLFRGVVL
ncbi:MAG: GlcNAc-PI de-N-acetylase [Anaerolineae bacterium]|nr:GlcNAc-PI de-N-acetylase [Anaerolineae bacterium]